MKKKLLVIIPIIIAVVTFFYVYRYYNKEDKTTTLTVTEKRWVENNKDQEYDFEIVNDYPLYGLNGEGVIFDFINDFEDKIGITFNKISYLKTTNPNTNSYRIRILDNDEKLSKNDLFLFDDNYVAVGKTYQRINHVQDMKNLKFGVFKEDKDEISYYLKSGTNLSYETYDSIANLYKALDDGTVNMIIVPNIMYLDYTIKNDKYSINYYFTELEKQIVLTLSDDNKELNTIVTKYYNKWKQTNYISEYNDEYLDYYLKNNSIDAKTKAKLISKNYVYGYVENLPYEKKVHGKVAGIAGEYIDRVSRLADINFEYKKYDSIKDLKEAIDNKEVDVYFDYYNYGNKNYLSTVSTFVEDYVVLGRQKDNHIVNTFESLKGQDLAMLKDDSLYNYFKNNSRANIKVYDNLDDLVENSGSRIIVIDNEIYSYYNYRNSGIENLKASILQDSTLEQVYTIVLIVVFTPLIILGLAFAFLKKKKAKKKVKISDRQKYTDMLTSLKNRNYLNAKMQEWEDCEVFPQSIVIVDLNNVKYVNDNYGHEEGDQLIIKAAGILVNTQLENSEIIRTDGNEFLIYLVGYSDRQISTYTKKLAKEMKNLPHEFGAAIGYSMITDEIKTLDDAINEATLEMITNKEEYK